MAFLVAGIVAGSIAVAGGAAKLGMSLAGRRDRINEQKAAQAEFASMKKQYENLDTSNLAAGFKNPYQNMENTMEDLKVNTQQAEFQAQQFQQSQANIMEGLRGAAGSSGIAALAQSLAGQGQLASQKAAASIGQQEAANQRAERAMAGQIQSKEREGDVYARGLQWDKTSTLLGMSQQQAAATQRRLGDARAAKTSAIAGAIQGVGNAAMAGLDAGAFDNIGKGTNAKKLGIDPNAATTLPPQTVNRLDTGISMDLPPLPPPPPGMGAPGGGVTGTASVDWGSTQGFMLNNQPFGDDTLINLNEY